MYGCVGLCRAMYGYVGLCMATYGYVWLCRIMYTSSSNWGTTIWCVHHVPTAHAKETPVDKHRMGLSSRIILITSIVQLVTVIGQKTSVAWCLQKWSRYLKWVNETATFKRFAGQEYTKKDYLACPLLFDGLRKKLVHIMKLRGTQRNRDSCREKRDVKLQW